MNRELSVPVLHMRGESDPYVLADPVHRSLPYAPNGQFVALRGWATTSTRKTPPL